MAVIKVTGLAVLAVYVTDLERAKSFYVDMLGFEEAGPMDPGFCLSAGDLTLYLEPGRKAFDKRVSEYPEASPCFTTDSVKGAFMKLREAGVKIVSEYLQFGEEFGMFRIADPDGNVIEFAGTP